MNGIYHHIRNSGLAFACLAGVLLLCQPAGAQIGFQAKFDTPSSWVSPYDDPDYRLSAAIFPKTFPLLARQLMLAPRVIRSSKAKSSLTFSAIYHRRGRETWELVPVSVDAQAYVEYRKNKFLLEENELIFSKNVAGTEQGRRGSGLGISVALPKRLNKIFGEGGAGLKVSGFRKITFSGRSQWTDAQSNLLRQNKFPSLSMEQISRFDITGTIGSKITVKVSQDSQTDIPLANRIQIRYKGDEDDILQSIEAGNTTLSLPNTQFVGYSARIRGLFGLKASARVGNLTFTTIASQEKGNAERTSITATGEESANYIRDSEYADNRIFDLGLPFLEVKDAVTGSTLFTYEQELIPGDSIINLFVYEQETRNDDIGNTLAAKLNVKPDDPGRFTQGEDLTPDFGVNQLDYGTEFTYEQDVARGIYYLVFNTRRLANRALAVYMEVLRAGNTIKFGEINNVDTLSLKTIKGVDPKPSFATWDLMWRNVYDLRQRGVDIDDLNIKVLKGLAGREGTTSSLDYQDVDGASQPYIEILGLDQYTLNRQVPDGRVDDRSEIWRSDWGLLIFPHRRPFNTDTVFVSEKGDSTLPLAVRNDTLYNYDGPQERTRSSQYYIQISTKSRSSIIRLNRPNIIENSERVLLNGRPLKKGEDFNINYDFGQITLLSDEALDPNADLTIDFEYTGFFAVQKKTLLGARAEYEWSKNFQFGTTLLYKSDKAEERKPRVGQETSKMAVIDFDATLKLHPNFLTKVANALPLVETSVPSTISLSGEVARSYPNPNVNGEAFVDDFESAIEKLSLSTARTSWRRAATPLQVKSDSAQFSRGHLLWHTPTLDPPSVRDVYDREPRQGEGFIRTLRLVFTPDPTNVDSMKSSWAGITRYFRGRIDSDRLQLFEIRARGTRGKLHFDFGVISEDLNGDNIADSEDRDNNAFVDEEEDIGLDLVPDTAETLAVFWGTDGDLAGDNFYFQGEGKCPLLTGCDNINWDDPENYYRWLNGTEGNIRDAEFLGIPDKEALSADGMAKDNYYFSFTLDLESSPFLVPNTEWPVAEIPARQFRTYRIPILDGKSLPSDIYSEEFDGNTLPDWTDISHVRVWFESDSGDIVQDTIEIAEWYFVQSNWRDSIIVNNANLVLPDSEHTSFVVASLSEEDNREFRDNPPPGVEQFVDPTTNVPEPRRALLLSFPTLQPGDTCLATKELITVDRYSGYGRMEMFVYGGNDPSLAPVTSVDSLGNIDTTGIVFFFRLGTNSDNFYEYRTFLYPEWDQRNWVNISFDEITALKDSVQKELPQNQRNREVDISQGNYRVFGDPNLNEILFFSAGIVSTFSYRVDSGEVWLDELRVTDVRKDAGTAIRFSAGGNIADLATYSFQIQSQDAFFRGLSTATRGGSNNNLGSGQTNTSYNLSWSMNLHKFLPPSWGAKLPVSFRYSKSTSTPLLRTRSDVVLPEDVREEERTISETEAISISESFQKKGNNPLFNLLLNRQTFSFSYRRTEGRSVNTPFTFGESYNAKSGFDLSVTKPPTVPIFFWTKWIPIVKKTKESRLSLYPASWRLSATYNRSLRLSDDINLKRTTTVSRDMSGTMDIRYNVFENLTTTLNYSTRRDLTDLEQVNFSLSDLRLGVETSYRQRFDLKYDPKLLSWFTTSYSFDATYSDNFERSTEARRSTLGQGWGVAGTFDHRSLLSGKAARAGRRRFGRRRGGVRTGEGAQEEKKEDGGKSWINMPASVLRFLTGWIEPVSYGYNEGYKNFVPGMLERPSFKYRFGLQRDANVPTGKDTRPPSSSEDRAYTLGSGFQLLGGIKTTVKFSRSQSEDLIRQGSRYKSTTTNWPDLTIRISQFKTFPLFRGILNKFISVFSPRTGFSRRERENFDLDKRFAISKSANTSYNPLLSINFKLWRSLSLSGSYSYSTEKSDKFNTGDGSIQTTTKSERRTIAATTRYSFSAPGGMSIPLFGKLKFTSTVNIDLAVKYSANKSETLKPKVAQEFFVSSEKSDFSIVPTISYSFSRQIRGGLSGRWQDTNDAKANRKSHVRQLQMWVEIRF